MNSILFPEIISIATLAGPIVKLMMGALKRAGWYVSTFMFCIIRPDCVLSIQYFANIFHNLCSPIDIRRHIACEVCDVSVSGGYDPMLNQVLF